MSDINSVSFTGRVGSDPELKYTQGGQAVLEIRFAVGGRKKEREQWIDTTTWLRTSTFGKRAEALIKLLRKGSRIGVTGKLEVRDYETKEGVKGRSVEVFSDDIVLLDAKREGGGGAGNKQDAGGFGGGCDDDIPF